MKKGFTLVELLAVIVILAIIATIATIVVFKIIEDTKIAKYKVEETSLKRAAEMYFVTNNIIPYPEEISLSSLIENGYMKPVVDNGNNGYCEGKVILEGKNNLKGCLKCSNYQTEGCGYTKEEPEVPEEPDDIVKYDEVTDPDPGIICGENNQDIECHIKSVEDLVAFSQLVNGGNDFSGKTVYLDANLDIQNDNSYVNASDNAPYNINGDGETTSLKDELTTDAGFMPIGNSTNPFAATFIGNAYTINNLMINRPSTDNVGLFAYVMGTSKSASEIIGLSVENVNIKANSFVGGIVGYVHSYANIIEVTVSGNVEGTSDYIGGIVGYVNGENSTVNLTNVISNTSVIGNQFVGGLVGGNFQGKISGIVESGNIHGRDNVYGTGHNATGTVTGYVNEKVTGYSILGGTLYKDSGYGNINLYNDYIDTWLGGDDDRSGYYFDYENDTSDKIVLKSTKTNPINTTLTQDEDGTYLINDENDMKKIAAMPTEQKKYKINNDIDYSNKHYYMIGIKNKPFSGTIDGGANTLKNIGIYGNNAVGLIGTSSNSLIQGLNVENIHVIGKTRLGGITGKNLSGTINEVTVSGTIESILENSYDQTFVGGILGTTESTDSIVTNSISSVNLIGQNYVGGLVGYNYQGKISGIVESGNIHGRDNVYRTGYNATGTVNGYVNEKVTVNSTLGGTLYKDSEYGNINLYNDYIDTWLGGDDDESGYYFDYENDTSNKIILKSTKTNPINTTLTQDEDGTYLINDENDMKKIAAMPTEQKKYKLNNSIDYSNKHYYMIGIENKPFSGTIVGGANTLKNIGIYGNNAVGLIGTSSNSLIQGLNVENIHVVGKTILGGITGKNLSGTINEVTVSGTIESILENSYDQTFVGGILGTTESTDSIVTNSISSVNLIGQNYVGGLVGYNYQGKISGIVESGNIRGRNNVYGTGYNATGTVNGYVNKKVTGYSTLGGTLFSESYYNNLEYYSALKINNKPVVETPYSGDSDGSGFYFDYNAKGDDIIVVKVKDTNIAKQEYTKTVDEGDDKTAPTCELSKYEVLDNGFSASYSCTDNVALKSKKHIYSASKITNFENLIEWGTTDTDGPVNSVWTVESASSQGISGPEKGVCYYFYFGGQDEAGNTVIYSTPTCLSY